MRDEAASALTALASPAELTRLPRDADFLGTLGHVAHTVVSLGELPHAAVAYELLAPHLIRPPPDPAQAGRPEQQAAEPGQAARQVGHAVAARRVQASAAVGGEVAAAMRYCAELPAKPPSNLNRAAAS